MILPRFFCFPSTLTYCCCYCSFLRDLLFESLVVAQHACHVTPRYQFGSARASCDCCNSISSVIVTSPQAAYHRAPGSRLAGCGRPFSGICLARRGAVLRAPARRFGRPMICLFTRPLDQRRRPRPIVQRSSTSSRAYCCGNVAALPNPGDGASAARPWGPTSGLPAAFGQRPRGASGARQHPRAAVGCPRRGHRPRSTQRHGGGAAAGHGPHSGSRGQLHPALCHRGQPHADAARG